MFPNAKMQVPPGRVVRAQTPAILQQCLARWSQISRTADEPRHIAPQCVEDLPRRFPGRNAFGTGGKSRTNRNLIGNRQSLKELPEDQRTALRTAIYFATETIAKLNKSHKFSGETESAVMINYKIALEKMTKFIPTWVKVAVAMALGRRNRRSARCQSLFSTFRKIQNHPEDIHGLLKPFFRN